MLVEPRIELVADGELSGEAELVEFGVGSAVPGPPVILSPHDVSSMLRSK